MSADIVPNEILHNVLSYLKGRDIFRCVRVCRRWKHVVAGFSDEFWRKACAEDHDEVHEEAYRKANISWFELYRSLTLWSQISAAKVTKSVLPSVDVPKFQLLENGILSCPEHHKEHFITARSMIAYYNLETLQEIHRESFYSIFRHYAENQNIIVLDLRQIRLIPKLNKDFYYQTDDILMNHCYEKKWELIGNEVYYQNDAYEFKRIKLVFKNGNVSWEIKVIADFMGFNEDTQLFYDIRDIKDMVKVSNNHFNLHEGTNIHSLIDDDIRPIASLSNDSIKPLYLKIALRKCLGFNWCSPADFVRDHVKLGFHCGIEASYTYGNMLLLGTNHNYDERRAIQIYCNPNGPFDNELNIKDVEPDLTIELDASCGVVNSKHTLIEHINVVEWVYGHKILVLFGGRIVVINLTHA